MGKNKRQKPSPTNRSKPQKGGGGKFSRPRGIAKPHPQAHSNPKKQIQAQHKDPTTPFSPFDRILLIGEGDLSFARSLVESHKCRNVIATVFESSEEELVGKYPHAMESIEALRASGKGVVVKFGVDAMKMGPWVDRKGKRGVGTMDRIIFNFPHVGGKSRDVNRQVRYHQELLVSFFRRALPSLSPNPGSSIIVTLFEGEPYTLWNIRDLGRHSGLEVKESLRFQAKAYPGYRHARTLGVVRSKSGGEDGERHGWRGEERVARSFVFVRRGEGQVQGKGVVKRKIGEISDEESDRSEDEGQQEDSQDEDEDEQEGWEGIEDSTDKEKAHDD